MKKKPQTAHKKERKKQVIAILIYIKTDTHYKPPQICISCTRKEILFQIYCMTPNTSIASTEQTLEQFLRKTTQGSAKNVYF